MVKKDAGWCVVHEEHACINQRLNPAICPASHCLGFTCFFGKWLAPNMTTRNINATQVLSPYSPSQFLSSLGLIASLYLTKLHRTWRRAIMGSLKISSTTGDDQPHVCVVGAGISGLRCADILLQQGFQVTMLEARNRIGGRVGLPSVGCSLQ
jgi:hypothetical protein